MNEEKSVLVCGIGETASAVARMLYKEGCPTAIHQESPPGDLRRRMCFADAWFDGSSTLDGVEARRVKTAADFIAGLRSREFIPILSQPIEDVSGRWPWDVLVDARLDETPRQLIGLADVSIGLGRGFEPGVDCDLAIETDEPDPGALVRAGAVPVRRTATDLDGEILRSECAGVFLTKATIGAVVASGEILGSVAGEFVRAPISGRIGGLARHGIAVTRGAELVEIVGSNARPVVGVTRRNHLISRGVAFAIEMECSGWEPVSFEDWM
jgi:xanthine dehydrogenase accessory factor